MNLKIMMVLMLCLNISSVYFMYGCASQIEYNNGHCGLNSNSVILDFFFDIDKIEILDNSTAIVISGNFTSATGDMLNPKTAEGGSTVAGLSIILDGLKMVLGFIALLTPLPLITFFSSLGIPSLFSMIFAPILFVMWIFGILDIIRGFKS